MGDKNKSWGLTNKRSERSKFTYSFAKLPKEIRVREDLRYSEEKRGSDWSTTCSMRPTELSCVELAIHVFKEELPCVEEVSHASNSVI